MSDRTWITGTVTFCLLVLAGFFAFWFRGDSVPAAATSPSATTAPIATHYGFQQILDGVPDDAFPLPSRTFGLSEVDAGAFQRALAKQQGRTFSSRVAAGNADAMRVGDDDDDFVVTLFSRDEAYIRNGINLQFSIAAALLDKGTRGDALKVAAGELKNVAVVGVISSVSVTAEGEELHILVHLSDAKATPP